MEVIFHLIKLSLIVLSSNGVDLQLLESKLCYFPAISLLFRTAGQTAGRTVRRLEKSILRLTQPQVELEAWAELGKKENKQCTQWSARLV
jgi:hypothetical protein